MQVEIIQICDRDFAVLHWCRRLGELQDDFELRALSSNKMHQVMGQQGISSRVYQCQSLLSHSLNFRHSSDFEEARYVSNLRIWCRCSIVHTVSIILMCQLFSPWAGGKMWWSCAAASLQAAIDAAYVSTTSNLFRFVSSCRGTWQGLRYLVIMYAWRHQDCSVSLHSGTRANALS